MGGITFQSLLRRAEIGANCYLLDTGTARIALDAGMHPKLKGLESLPLLELAAEPALDAIVVTHAHLDHVGALPVLMRQHPSAPVFMTGLTAEFAEAMLHNSANVMGWQREQEAIREYPLFTHREVDACTRRWQQVRPGRSFEIGETGVRAEFFDAGHLPGAAGVMFYVNGRRIFYTGDVHFEDQTLTLRAEFPSENIDVLIMECTRGAAARAADYSREREAWRLAEHIMSAIGRGGSVLIPVFALGKTQEMLLLLHELRRSGRLASRVPIHIGGLSTRMTTIIDRHGDDDPRRRHRGFRILDGVDHLIPARRGERDLSSAPGRIYALSSGMMTENTASNDFAFRLIDNPKNSVLLVGYADPDSPAGALLRTARGEGVRLNQNHPPMPLRAAVENFDFSGHAPRESLVEYAARVRPRQLLLVHGDADATAWMAAAVKNVLPETDVIVPSPGEQLRLNG